MLCSGIHLKNELLSCLFHRIGLACAVPSTTIDGSRCARPRQGAGKPNWAQSWHCQPVNLLFRRCGISKKNVCWHQDDRELSVPSIGSKCGNICASWWRPWITMQGDEWSKHHARSTGGGAQGTLSPFKPSSELAKKFQPGNSIMSRSRHFVRMKLHTAWAWSRADGNAPARINPANNLSESHLRLCTASAGMLLGLPTWAKLSTVSPMHELSICLKRQPGRPKRNEQLGAVG